MILLYLDLSFFSMQTIVSQNIKSFDYENVSAEHFLYWFLLSCKKRAVLQIQYCARAISTWMFLNCGLGELWPKEDQTFVHMQMKSSHSKNMILRFLFWKQFFFHCIWTVFLLLLKINCERINEEIPC